MTQPPSTVPHTMLTVLFGGRPSADALNARADERLRDLRLVVGQRETFRRGAVTFGVLSTLAHWTR